MDLPRASVKLISLSDVYSIYCSSFIFQSQVQIPGQSVCYCLISLAAPINTSSPACAAIIGQKSADNPGYPFASLSGSLLELSFIKSSRHKLGAIFSL
jgi:hypothetical protein